MTHGQFEMLSNQAVAACAVVYFLAVLAHFAQWAAARRVPEKVEETVGAAGASARTSAGGHAPERDPDHIDSEAAERMHLFGRVGVALTVVAAFLHLIALVAGASPRTRCGCPGGTCTSSC